MTEIPTFREHKDEYFAHAADSPIPAEHRQAFTGLDYYDEDPALAMRLELQPADGGEVRVQTSDGQERVYTRDARISFSVAGEAVTLTLYGTDRNDGYFLPFRDATSGGETYGAGRYIDVPPATDGVVAVDFNLAYNPYCAYSDGYSCPLPPVENWLSVPIRAGERDYAIATSD